MTEQKPNLMVVDDEPLIGELLTRYFTKNNYEVKYFANGKRALDYLKNNPVDLMMTDMRMPDMNGLEVVKASKSLRPEMPILVMTSHLDEDAIDVMTQLGVVDYFTKPFELKAIGERVAAKLGRTQS
ncbi:MAG: response regulator [Planctomycetes bacterium]|nr:response regulator [Planctomycetota bacterium]